MDTKPQRGDILARVERVLTGNPSVETVLNIFKAALSTAPFAGGISSLITDYIPSSRVLRLEQFAEQVASDLKEVAAKVDVDYIRTDEFAFIFERSFRGAAENYQREKLEAFRGILVNSVIRTDIEQEEKEYFLVLANNLSILHLRILRLMAEPKQYLADLRIDERRVRGGFTEMFGVVIPGVDPSVIQSAFGDLYQSGLITTDKNIFGTMTSAQGLQLLGDRVSDLGHRFIGFCSTPVATPAA
jgi:hypothetical protein